MQPETDLPPASVWPDDRPVDVVKSVCEDTAEAASWHTLPARGAANTGWKPLPQPNLDVFSHTL